jgi:hypothetical protein
VVDGPRTHLGDVGAKAFLFGGEESSGAAVEPAQLGRLVVVTPVWMKSASWCIVARVAPFAHW